MKQYICLVIFMLSAITMAQVVDASINTNQIKFGQGVELTIKTKVQENDKVAFPKGQFMGDFEVIEEKPIDTLLKNRKWELTKKYILTHFDTGSYKLPAQQVFINQKNYNTKAFDIKIVGVETDTLQQPMYDIKGNIDVKSNQSSIWLYYAISLLISVLIGFLIYFIIKKIQQKNITEDDLFRTPLEKAISRLNNLDKKQLIINGKIKDYYSEITDIIRDYIEEVFEISAKEMPSSELLSILQNTLKTKKIKINKEVIYDLKNVLQTADLVKFAKSEPEISKIENDRAKTLYILEQKDNAIPEFREQLSEKMHLREVRFKRRKQIRTWIPISVSSLLVLATTSVFLYQNFSSYFTFNSNAQLLKKQWITSSYGYPPIKISTPEVLQRTVEPYIKGRNNKNAEFKYINVDTKLSIFLRTISQDKKEEIELKNLLNYRVNSFGKLMKITNLQSQSENINTKNTESIRGWGTFQSTDILYAYGVLLINHSEGIQEVTIIYNQKDEDAQKIAVKVFESINID